jgi:hypothetical protein
VEHLLVFACKTERWSTFWFLHAWSLWCHSTVHVAAQMVRVERNPVELPWSLSLGNEKTQTTITAAAAATITTATTSYHDSTTKDVSIPLVVGTTVQQRQVIAMTVSTNANDESGPDDAFVVDKQAPDTFDRRKRKNNHLSILRRGNMITSSKGTVQVTAGPGKF